MTREKATWVVDQVIERAAASARLAGFLAALAAEGETPTEIRGIADAIVSHAPPVDVEGEVLGTVGTRGDGLQTVNASAMAALVIAAAGILVVKYGNKASSLVSGSVDRLETLDANLNLSSADAVWVSSELGITLVLTDVFHPAMRSATSTRRESGIATVFSILDPLTNPARPAVSIIDVSRLGYTEPAARVLTGRGLRDLVMRGCDNRVDEFLSATVNDLWEIEGDRVKRHEFDAISEAGVAPITIDDLHGGSSAFDAEVVRALLQGQAGVMREAVLLNVAGAFVTVGTLPGTGAQNGSFTERIHAGIQIAADTVDSDTATRPFDR